MLPVECVAAPGLVERPACVDDSRGFRVLLASACPAAAVDIGRFLAAAGGLGTGLVGLVWRAISAVAGGSVGLGTADIRKRSRARGVVSTRERHSGRAMGAALTRPKGIASASARARACGVCRF